MVECSKYGCNGLDDRAAGNRCQHQKAQIDRNDQANDAFPALVQTGLGGLRQRWWRRNRWPLIAQIQKHRSSLPKRIGLYRYFYDVDAIPASPCGAEYHAVEASKHRVSGFFGRGAQ